MRASKRNARGYALFLLPAYCVFIVYQRGFAAAIKVGAVAVAPMMLSLLVTLTFAGWEGGGVSL